MPVNSMKLPGDPWNNLWSGCYELHGIFLWNSMENVQILHGKYRWENLHGNWFPYPAWNSMATFSMEFYGKCPNPSWRYFPWKSMKIDVLLLHGIPWRFFTRDFEIKKIIKPILVTSAVVMPSLTFCPLNIIWSTIVVYLPILVKNEKKCWRYVNSPEWPLLRGGLA